MELQPVKPGDLIKADVWNALLEDMRQLEARIAALESSDGRVEIIDVQFTPPLRVGDVLRVLGRNFRTSTRTARAFLDGRETLPDPNTFSATRMDLTIPEEVNPPPDGKQVQLLVSNVVTNDTRRLTVLPREIILSGPIDVQWVSVQPATIVPGGDIFWEYTARSRASKEATFTIRPRPQPAGLIDTAQFQVLEADRATPRASSQITLDPRAAAPSRFFLRLSPFPALAANTRFSLSIELLVGGQLYTASDPEAFTVGQPTEQPDPNIDLTISAIDPERDAAGNFVWVRPNTVQFRAGVPAVQVQLLAVFRAAGTYRLAPVTAAGWSVDGSDNAAEYPISAADLATGGGQTRRTLTYFIQPAAGAVERTLTVTLQRSGETRRQEITLVLRPQ